MEETQFRDDDILTVEQVAELLLMTPAWVRAHANHSRRPYLPGFKAGKYIRFRRGAVREAITKWERHAEARLNA
jgi:hypothetical protein